MLPRVSTTATVLPSLRIVSSRTVLHHSVCVDLSPIRAVHALEHCPCITDPSLGLNGADCGSVHYGLCSPLLLRPAVDIQTLQTLTPIVAKGESYRDKIQAAIELLAIEEEPADLETLLRNFVREDRKRQETKLSTVGELESKTPKKIIIRSRPLSAQSSDGKDFGNASVEFRNKTTQNLVRSRLTKFDQPIERSRSLSPSPSPSTPAVDNSLSSLESSTERLIFGISPKSNSLSRYKSIIESRKSNTSSQTTNPFVNINDNKDNKNNGSNQLSEDLKSEKSSEPQKQRKTIVRNTPVFGSGPKIDGSYSAQTLPSGVSPTSEDDSFESTPSLNHLKSSQISSERTPRTASNEVSNCESELNSQLSVPLVRAVTTSTSTSASTSSSSTSFNKSCTSNVNTNCELKNKIDGKNKVRPLSAPETSIEDFIAYQLTDDEKAILQRNTRNNIIDESTQMGAKNMNTNCENKETGITTSANKPKSGNDRSKPRIITLSRPLPKPEPKAAEPKYVNGKLVFGQIPVKPCLAKGSVAERVLLFEKCPEKTSVTKLRKTDRSREKITYNKVGQWMKLNDNNNNTKNEIISRRFSRSNSLTLTCPPGQLPKFYYPVGRPYSSHEVESQIRRIGSVFDRFPSRIVGRKEFATILKVVGIPLYWKEPLFRAVLTTINDNNIKIDDISNGNGNGKKEVITCDSFVDFWKKIISTCYDNCSRFFKMVTNGKRNYILAEDFGPMIQDVIDTHPGLAFLREAEEFHSRYIHTVIARIFYCVNKSWTGRITLPELRKSNFLQIVSLLEEEDDINQITDYFSYEHFYVIYCKFWELDRDHDLFISKSDLSRHNDSAISSPMIDRIFSGAVTRGQTREDGLMSYSEFVWFLLSEEDKRHPRSIEYWFRCMDTDGDGFLSMYELEYFYSEQTKRMEAIGIEALPFNDCLCQMLDLVRPQISGKISLSDLKRCRLTPIFFDTFFNLEKYLDHEQRDPFASSRDEDGLSMSDWDRYAAEEYELLVAEESAQQNTQQNTQNLLDFTGEGENGLNEYIISNPNKCGLRARSLQSKGYTDEDSDYCHTHQ